VVSTVVFGASVLLGAVLAYAVADAMVKWLSAYYSIVEITFFRSAFGFLPLIFVAMRLGGFRSLHTKQLPLHVLRALFGTAAMFLFFYSYSALPLAVVTSLSQTYPLFIVLLSGLVLGNRTTLRQWFAVMIGFAGVLLIVHPNSSVFTWVSLVPLVASACVAGFLLMLRLFSPSESHVSLMLYTLLLASLSSGAMLPWSWVAPEGADWIVLASMGILGGVGFFLRNLAYRVVSPATIAPIEYLQVPIAALIGIAIFDEVPGINLAAGALLLVLSNFYALYSAAGAERAQSELQSRRPAASAEQSNE
jgi:drug/metabolite transporter (DMT)-like permease